MSASESVTIYQHIPTTTEHNMFPELFFFNELQMKDNFLTSFTNNPQSFSAAIFMNGARKYPLELHNQIMWQFMFALLLSYDY
ncbi:CLUMA_CG009702, isoform A [Clunio marinus]|uniref:CLUMA_CG009702, isoform A n=1 Tax=Clunio marinus TaxID=568069 RepID=A0A1J1I7P3_9DIPT|nr:CLUMA_CG009702, isoform A [Clunio marinus]